MFSSIKRRLSQGLSGLNAQVAQLVEQGTENPCVGGSIPSLGTTPKTTPSKGSKPLRR